MHAEKIHNRQAQDLPINAQVAPVVVDDPFDHLAKIQVFRSTKDDPLAKLHVRKQIDDAQYHAGRAYQRDWETAERGPRAIDPTKEAVDGGRMPEPLTEGQRKAAKKLNAVLEELGTDKLTIVHEFLVERLTVAGIAFRRGQTTERWVKYFGGRVRGALEDLAVVYGLASRR